MDQDKGTSVEIEQQDVQVSNIENLGFSQQTPRNISGIGIICISWNICASWAGIAGTLALTLDLGGSVTLIYGVIVIFIFVGCSGLTLAELASVYPTAGGQYHYTSILTPARASRPLSYACGITNVYAWIAGTSGVAILVTEGLLAMVISYQPDYVPEKWHYFLVFQAINGLACLHNIFTLRRTLWIYDIAFVVTLLGFFVIVITCLARASPKQPSEIVWTNFVDESGWPDGVSFLTGLVSANYMYAGLDGAIHLAEEVHDAARVVPRAIVCTLLIGLTTSFSFVVAMTYCIVDFEAVIATPTGFPIYEIWIQATRSHTAATIFMLVLLVAGVVALIAIQQTASRLTWSFARDNALVRSSLLGKIHADLQTPVWSLIANNLIVFVIGCIFLGSSTAFNAFIGTGLILGQVTYAIPAALLMFRKRSEQFLPRKRAFRLPSILGWIANALTVVFSVLVLIFYDFPVILPVTGSNMNYTSAVLGVMAIFAVANWFLHARKKYHGPRLMGQ